jgi:hypothetical protein
MLRARSLTTWLSGCVDQASDRGLLLGGMDSGTLRLWSVDAILRYGVRGRGGADCLESVAQHSL